MCPGRALTSPQPRHSSQPAPPARPRDPCCKGRSRVCCHPLVLAVRSGTRPSNEAMESITCVAHRPAGQPGQALSPCCSCAAPWL